MNRDEVRQKLVKWLDAGLSVHLAGLPSLGTSRWLRGLEIEGRKLIYVDGHSKPVVLPKEDEISNEPAVTIIIDHFGVLLENETAEFFNQLRSLRDRFKYKLTYLVATTRYHTLTDWRETLGGMFELTTEAKIYFPAMNEGETQKAIDDISKRVGCTISDEERVKIWRYSGGIGSLVKSQVLVYNSDHVLEEVMLERDRGIIQGLWHALTENQRDFLLHLTDSGGDKQNEALRQWKLVNDEGIVSQSLRWFIEQFGAQEDNLKNEEIVHKYPQISESLPPIEYRLFSQLYSRIGHLCVRDDLVASGWPDDNAEGVSDEALDQAMSRLRRKLQEVGFVVKTVKGRGYMLEE